MGIIFEYSVNCRSMGGEVRFCSSHGCSRVSSYVVVNSLEVGFVDAGLRLVFPFSNFPIELKFSAHPSMGLRDGGLRVLCLETAMNRCHRLRLIVPSDPLNLLLECED